MPSHPADAVQFLDYDNEIVLLVDGARAGQVTWTLEQDQRAFADDGWEDAAGDHNGYHLVVGALVVYPEYRHQGHGRALMDRFVAHAEQRFGPKGWLPGAFTADGAAFWAAYRGEVVPVTERIVYGEPSGAGS